MSNASLELGGDNWAAKDGNLLGYAVGDSSGKYVPREFTFTRGSNLAATRVAANGLIEKGRENLATYSNDFSNAAWTMSGSAPIGGQDGYDGSNDAWSITGDVGDNWLFKRNDTIIQKSGIQTFSIYVKKNATYGIRIYFFGTANANTYFNLSNGTIVNASNTIDSKIEPVGSDWFRCSITFEQTTTQMYLYATNNENVMLDGITHILQDAQLEQGLVATDYIETGATTVQAGLLEDEPRIDYTGGTGSLLLEPSRTNLVRYSECFDEWGHYSNVTAQLANVLSPEGKLNAYEFTFDGTTSGRIQDTIPVTNGNTYTFSVYLKNKNISTPTQVWIGFSNPPSQGEYVTVTNEWQRFETTQVADSGSAEYPRVLCNGVGSIYGYGAQLEEGSYKTSYIPNHSGGSVTRSADFCSGAGDASTFNDAEGVLYAEISALADDLTFRTIIINDGSNANRVLIRYRTTSNVINFLLTASSSTIKNVTFPVTDITDVHKIAIAYKSGDIRLYIDGVQVGSFTNAFTLSSLNNLSFMNYNGDDPFYGNVKQVLYFPTALSDAQCSALTVEGLKEEILTSYIAAVDTLEDGAEARLDTYLQNLEDLIV